MGTGPTGQFFIPTLGIGMAQAMHFRQPRVGGLALIDTQLLYILPVAGDQGSQSRQRLRVFQYRPLGVGTDWHRPGTSTLSPAGLKLQAVTLVAPPGLDLQRLLPTQPEGCL